MLNTPDCGWVACAGDICGAAECAIVGRLESKGGGLFVFDKRGVFDITHAF